VPDPRELLPGDPARRRYKRLLRALGDPTLTADQIEALARLCAWSTLADINVLVRAIDRRSRAAFEMGRLNAQVEQKGD
jgi:hypothetical protein